MNLNELFKKIFINIPFTYLYVIYLFIYLFGYREELSKCQEHMEQLQKDKELVSSEIVEAQSQNNM